MKVHLTFTGMDGFSLNQVSFMGELAKTLESKIAEVKLKSGDAISVTVSKNEHFIRLGDQDGLNNTVIVKLLKADRSVKDICLGIYADTVKNCYIFLVHGEGANADPQAIIKEFCDFVLNWLVANK